MISVSIHRASFQLLALMDKIRVMCNPKLCQIQSHLCLAWKWTGCTSSAAHLPFGFFSALANNKMNLHSLSTLAEIMVSNLSQWREDLLHILLSGSQTLEEIKITWGTFSKCTVSHSPNPWNFDSVALGWDSELCFFFLFIAVKNTEH